MQKVDHKIGIQEKRQFFRRKLGKIAENCDHNIGPSLRKQESILQNSISAKKLDKLSYSFWTKLHPNTTNLN
jgi:hypothetical protein